MGGLSGLVKGIFGDPGAPIRAGEIQAASTDRGIEETRRQFDITQANFQPILDAGSRALTQQEALLGLSGDEAQQQAFDNFKESPGQAFLRKRQEKALLRNNSAIGGLGGGNVRTALQEQGAQIAQQDLDNQLNRLAGISGAGQTATQNVASFGQQATNQINQLTGQGADAQASGILGANQIRANRGSLLLGAGGGVAAGLLSDKNMKHDINDLSLKDCFDAVISMPLKTWRYLDDVGLGNDLHLGPMAQDAPEVIKIEGKEMLDLHDELMLIAGALQYAKKEGLSWQ